MRRERNIFLGVVLGFFLACCYSLFVVAKYVIQGNAAFEANRISLGTTIVVYLIGGVLGGAIVGFLLPWTRRRIGSVFVGMLAALPVCLGLGVAVHGWITTWDHAAVFAWTTTAMLLGGFGGYTFWRPESNA